MVRARAGIDRIEQDRADSETPGCIESLLAVVNEEDALRWDTKRRHGVPVDARIGLAHPEIAANEQDEILPSSKKRCRSLADHAAISLELQHTWPNPDAAAPSRSATPSTSRCPSGTRPQAWMEADALPTFDGIDRAETRFEIGLLDGGGRGGRPLPRAQGISSSATSSPDA